MTDGLTFTDYQRGTRTTAVYADSEEMPTRRERLLVIGGLSFVHHLDALAHAGRNLDQFKKFIRDGKTPGIGYGAQSDIEDDRLLKLDVGVIYTLVGFLSEAGEVAEVLSDFLGGEIDEEEFAKRIEKENGDALWYLSECATEFGRALSAIAQANLDKLADRKARDKIHGSGDER